MTQKKSRTQIASAVSLALSSMVLSAGLNAGVINNSNPSTTSAFLGTCGDPDTAPIACVGAWDLGNVTVKLFRADGTEFGIGTFDETDVTGGTYETMLTGDSFSSVVNDWDDPSLVMAKIGGKVWPIGEPTGIKAVYGDTKVKNGKPGNCIINTAYLDGLNDSDKTTDIDAYLNSAKPEPVICSSGFQTHKRFKIAMQPATVATVDPVTMEGQPIDLVFNVTDGGGLQRYQVFSKINNYTGKRLSGYMVQVGTGTGTGFMAAAEQGIEQKLFISRGIGEGMDDIDGDGAYTDPNGENLFVEEEGLATFSRGLFGPEDTTHVPPRFPTDGFFDQRYAGFNVVPDCSSTAVGACPERTVYDDGAGTVITQTYADTIRSDGALLSNYVEAPVNFGDWLHSGIAPMGIFFDPDSDPSTDNDLMAYWNGTQWIQRYPTFTPVDAATLNTWAADPRFTVDVIEDTLNLGINYIVNVGDDLDGDTVLGETSKITIRIVPIVGDQTQSTPWMTALPAAGDLLPVSATTATTSSDGGGCTVGGSGRFDPTLPALLAMGLGFFGWRRFKAGK